MTRAATAWGVAIFLGLGAMTPAAAQQPRTLIVAAPAVPTGFDGDIPKVATRPMVTQVYEGLVRYKHVLDASGRGQLDPNQIEPNLAESWVVSEGGTVITFKLRQGVKSPYGNEMTSDDVVWSWNRGMAVKRTTFFLANMAGFGKVEATGKYEIKFTLKTPNTVFLPTATTYFPQIHDATEVKKHTTAEDPWGNAFLDQNTAGFGAYTLQSLRPGEQAVLVANPNWYRGKPFFERVIYREVQSAANRIALLKTGQVQWVEDLNLRQISELKRDKSVKVESVEGTQPATIRMNPAYKPFDDKRVRLAMIYAADYDAINNLVFEGLGVPVRSMVSNTIPTVVDAYPYKRDVAKAKALLAEAGYPNGIDVQLNYAGVNWWMEPLAIQFKNTVAEAGIRVELQRLPDSEFIQRVLVAKRDVPFFTHGDPTFVLDPFFQLFIFGHSKGPTNRNGYFDATFDKLVEAGLVEQDPGKRADLSRQAQLRHGEDANWINFFFPGVHQAMAPCITGWLWYPDDWPRFSDLRCDK